MSITAWPSSIDQRTALQGGTLELTITYSGGTHTAAYEYADGTWNITDPAAAPRLAAGEYEAAATGTIIVPYGPPKIPNDYDIIPVEWTGTFTVEVDSAAGRAVMPGWSISLDIRTARMSVALFDWMSGSMISEPQSFEVRLHNVRQYPSGDAADLVWKYPAHSHSRCAILPQELTGECDFITLTGTLRDSKYYNKTYKLVLPAGKSFFFYARHGYQIRIRIDDRTGEAWFSGIGISTRI